MKRNTSNTVWMLLGMSVAMASILTNDVLADNGLDALKSIAQGAKVLQDKMKQGAQIPPSGASDGAVEQGAIGANPFGETDEAALKTARGKMDVVGVKIGTSLDEALRALKAHNPKLVVVQKHVQTFSRADNKPHPVLHIFATGERPRAVEQIYLTTSLPPGQHVVHVDRTVTYQISDAPTVVTTLAALRSKYGEPSSGISDTPNNRQLLWIVGMGAGGNNTCNGFDFRFQAWTLSKNNIRKGCGFVVSARVRPFNENPSLVTELAIGITDFRMASQDWESSYQYIAGASKKRERIEIEDANKRAPKI